MKTSFTTALKYGLSGLVLSSGLCILFSFTHPSAEQPAYAWLAGSWSGDGFGGQSEEIWSMPAEDGTMMGMYRHHKGDGSLNFYEFLILDESGMHLKHFSPELDGWEEKEDHLTFEMVSYDERSIILKGLEFELKDENSMEIRLRMKQKDGEFYTEVFSMRRK